MFQKHNTLAMFFLQSVKNPMLLLCCFCNLLKNQCFLIPFSSFSKLFLYFLSIPTFYFLFLIFPGFLPAFFFLLPPSSFLIPRFSSAIAIRNMKCMILGTRATCIYLCICIYALNDQFSLSVFL